MGDVRERSFVLGSSVGYISIAITTLVTLLSIPLKLHYFGGFVYGFSVTLSSITGYLSVSDLGVGLAVLSLLSGTTIPEFRRQVFIRGLKILAYVSAGLVAVILVVGLSDQGLMGVFGNIPVSDMGVLHLTAVVGLVTVALQIPLRLISAAFSGLQRMHWSKIYESLASIVGFLALLATVILHKGILVFVVVTGCGSTLLLVLSGVHLLKIYPELFVGVTRVPYAPSERNIVSSGMKFLVLQLSVLIILNTDNLVIAHFLGSTAVTPYSVTFKLFQLAISVIGVVTSVMWPILGRALAQDDWPWIRKMYRLAVSLLLSFGGLVWLGGLFFSHKVIMMWAGPSAYGGFLTVFSLGGYVYLQSLNMTESSFINSILPSKTVVAVGVAEAVLNLILSLAFVRLLGPGGVALATFLASLVTFTWFAPIYVARRTGGKIPTGYGIFLIRSLALLPFLALGIYVNIRLSNSTLGVCIGVVSILAYASVEWILQPKDIRTIVLRRLCRPPGRQVRTTST